MQASASLRVHEQTAMIWYAVGSRDEEVGGTGLSHYLEHMLFKGTEKLPVGSIDRITQANGGSNNASTRNDATASARRSPRSRAHSGSVNAPIARKMT